MGLRVTDEKMIKIVENVMTEFNNKIVETFKKGTHTLTINMYL